ncbi:YdcF family protein [candidate division KSB1 bacterium]|nr:YdcF family protein [candidate division KSB1 bacterium]
MPNKQSPNEHTLIVVLGSPNSETGQLYSIARERCELAMKLFHENPGAKLLLTGGFGAHFNVSAKPHAFYLQKYLMERGIPESAFLEFALSSNTLEDASLSKPIILNTDSRKITIVTSDYHYPRAKFIFEREFLDISLEISFCTSITNAEKCEIDLEPLKKHEKMALEKLKRQSD